MRTRGSRLVCAKTLHASNGLGCLESVEMQGLVSSTKFYQACACMRDLGIKPLKGKIASTGFSFGGHHSSCGESSM